MKRSSARLLMMLTLAAGVALIACSGNGSKENGTEPTAAERPAVEAFLGDVPVYPAATMQTNSGAEGSGAALSGLPAAPPAIVASVDVKNYAKIKLAVYDTNDSPGQVFDWYKSRMTDWNEEWSSRGDSVNKGSASAIWTRDGGKEAAWMVASEDGGKTTIYLWWGS